MADSDPRIRQLQGVAARLHVGEGVPVLNTAEGHLYLRTDGGTNTTLYVNETGGTGGWVAK